MNENKSGFVKLIHTFPVPAAAITERFYKSATTNLSHTLLRHVGLDGTASHAVRASPRPPTHAHTPRITTPFISLCPWAPFFSSHRFLPPALSLRAGPLCPPSPLLSLAASGPVYSPVSLSPRSLPSPNKHERRGGEKTSLGRKWGKNTRCARRATRDRNTSEVTRATGGR
jgi:hypothetical protein